MFGAALCSDEPWYSDTSALWNPGDSTWALAVGCVAGGLLLCCCSCVWVLRRRRLQGVGGARAAYRGGGGDFQDITPSQVSRQVGGWPCPLLPPPTGRRQYKSTELMDN